MSDGFYGKHPMTGERVWIQTGHVPLDAMIDGFLKTRQQGLESPASAVSVQACDRLAGLMVDTLALEFAGLDPDVVLTVALQVLGRFSGQLATGVPLDIAFNAVGTAVAMWAGKIERPGAPS